MPVTSSAQSRAALFEWVLRKGRGLSPDELTGTTPLLQARHIRSLQIPELILFLEKLRDRPVDVLQLRAGDFADIDTICGRFLTNEDVTQ